MRALVSHAYGPLEKLSIEDVPVPVPGPHQVLVRVEGAALNPVDVKLVTGAMRKAMPVTHPFVPGVDVTGVVEEVGRDVTRFAVGDPVLAWNGASFATLAEYALVDDDFSSAKHPANLDVRRASSLPTGAMTAAALVAAADLSPGMDVLVVGAAGGVGSFVVQLAKQAGARVIATGRAEDGPFLDGLGADLTVDYTKDDIAPQVLALAGEGVQVVIDVANAGQDLAVTAAAARPGGRIVSSLGGPREFLDGVSAVYTGRVARHVGRSSGARHPSRPHQRRVLLRSRPSSPHRLRRTPRTRQDHDHLLMERNPCTGLQHDAATDTSARLRHERRHALG
ncbi:NADPH:quinone reductase-like Zn-dependent oxidoreductase [Streptosporangium album]|uniref:NADPH:quinone reductase-like Zn-dependent oxidoreductase n=1 Tax=Streptosporangium album TaxID=47479 RepID=A0A7W7W8B7_9ACTN|nr:NADP-dependent oxidoreductase [Streptosporangium album]MBB4936810.1 NADPH:quinone reductase-like Zn-dependent oxidoreductase [Streptosporangium album]